MVENENNLVELPERRSRVVVKFAETTDVHLEGARIASADASVSSEMGAALDGSPTARLHRYFDDTEAELRTQVANASSASGTPVPALDKLYAVDVDNEDEAHQLCDRLARAPGVEEAYIEPPAYPALFEIPPAPLELEVTPTSPNYRAQQRYLDRAPAGIDAVYAWTRRGGRGDGVRIVDIEGGWNFSHEDLRRNQGGVIHGTNSSDLGWVNHGTAVQGEIAGDDNPFGVLGIVPNALFSAASIFGPNNSPAKAIKAAADRLSPGDIILIELHRPGPDAGGRGQDGFIAIEWWSADFAATKYATSKGIIVVAAAGNGFRDLDAPAFRRRFDRRVRDSGAILVGAGAPPTGNHGPDRSRLDFSNWGSIVDAQGWGRDVVTTGYGDLQGGANRNRWYTARFSGTSSASPIVVGAIASLQGIVKARSGRPLTPVQARTTLRQTGTPQTDGLNGPRTQRIGNRPNLRDAIGKHDRVRTVPLYRYWNARATDHFYTTNWRELGPGRHGWRFEGIQCHVFPRRLEGTVPLYRYWNPRVADHFYTTNWRELGRGRYGYRYEGIQCWVHARRPRSAVPLYRYWNPRVADHFYTTNWRELGAGGQGYRYEGVQCYVFPRPVRAPTDDEDSASGSFEARYEEEVVAGSSSDVSETVDRLEVVDIEGGEPKGEVDIDWDHEAPPEEADTELLAGFAEKAEAIEGADIEPRGSFDTQTGLEAGRSPSSFDLGSEADGSGKISPRGDSFSTRGDSVGAGRVRIDIRVD